ncbi:hypothetical protein EYF80_023177 [Liparis tanakae]|uniref:Uncharacterized protein n=1 Tax=Liparis tanakae TaxID=230148 RepID=A0A4Z2HNS9_9TELE|nr:hypothetical protein EYF80_023177 [Liparis tanakae]
MEPLQTVLTSWDEYHFCLCVARVNHTIQEDTFYLSYAISDVEPQSQAPSRGRALSLQNITR